jgi:hypothetical protein
MEREWRHAWTGAVNGHGMNGDMARRCSAVPFTACRTVMTGAIPAVFPERGMGFQGQPCQSVPLCGACVLPAHVKQPPTIPHPV